MATQTLVTPEQFEQLPQEEGREYELLDGEVIEMPSATGRHNGIVSRLSFLSGPVWFPQGLSIPDTEFAFGSASRLRPDLAILLNEKRSLVDLDRLPITVAPDIAIEVISPSESAWRVDARIRVYLKGGVREVWILYPETRSVYVYRGKEVLGLVPGDVLTTPMLPDWSVPVDQIFAI